MKPEIVVIGTGKMSSVAMAEIVEITASQVTTQEQLTQKATPYVLRNIDTLVRPYIEPRKKETRGWTKNNRHK